MVRNVLFALVACGLVAVCTSTPAFSLLSAEDSAENLLSIGENTIQIMEDFDPKPNEFGEVKKVVSVTNTQDVTCFVRVRLVPNYASAIATYHTNDSYWTRQADGFWYYALPVAGGETTEPLLYGFTLAGGERAPSNVVLLVYAESAEAYGADAPEAAFLAYEPKEESCEEA